MKFSPARLERYPDHEIERYYGYYGNQDYGVELRRIGAKDALERYPRLVAHMICHSLGYCTPTFAGTLVLAAARNAPHHCEWISACYGGDPWPALWAAIDGRHGHKGYMADFHQALDLVQRTRAGAPDPLFASWF